MPIFGLDVSCLCSPIPAPRLEGYGWPFRLQPPLPCLSRLTGPEQQPQRVQTPGPAPCMGVFYRHTHRLHPLPCFRLAQLSLSVLWQSSPLPAWPGESPAAIFPEGGQSLWALQQSQPPLLQVGAEALAAPSLRPSSGQPLGLALLFLFLNSISCILTICNAVMPGFETPLWRAELSVMPAAFCSEGQRGRGKRGQKHLNLLLICIHRRTPLRAPLSFPS